jgi:hypothetical protein
MKNILLIVLILAALTGVVFLLRQTSVNAPTQPARSTHSDSILIVAVKESLRWQLETLGVRLDGAVMTEDEQRNASSLRHIIGRSSKVLFHFSDLSCSACIDSELPLLKQLREEVGDEKVLIVTSYDSRRSFEVFKQTSGIYHGIYNLRGARIGLPTEEIHLPCLLLVDSSLVVRFAFIPLKESPQLSNIFYEIAKKRLKAAP